MQLGPPGQFGSLTADVARVTGGRRARSHEERLRSDVRAFLNKGEISCVWAVSGHILHVIATATMFVLYPGVEISLRIFEPPPPYLDLLLITELLPHEGQQKDAAAMPVACFRAPQPITSVRCHGAAIFAGCSGGAVRRRRFWRLETKHLRIVWVMGALCNRVGYGRALYIKCLRQSVWVSRL